jgi:hypothetical protein
MSRTERASRQVAAVVKDADEVERRARERAATVEFEGPGAAGWDVLALACARRAERGEAMPWETADGSD